MENILKKKKNNQTNITSHKGKPTFKSKGNNEKYQKVEKYWT